MSDLVKRLRDLADSAAVGKKLYAGAFVVLEAADLIDQQAARIAALEEGLRSSAVAIESLMREVSSLTPRDDTPEMQRASNLLTRIRALLGGSNAE